MRRRQSQPRPHFKTFVVFRYQHLGPATEVTRLPALTAKQAKFFYRQKLEKEGLLLSEINQKMVGIGAKPLQGLLQMT